MSTWLDAAEKRCEAATSGPWFTESTPKDEDGWPTCSMVAGVSRGQLVYACPPGGSFPANDQRFIAEARTDLPRALSLLRELEQAVETYRRNLRATTGLRADNFLIEAVLLLVAELRKESE